MQLYPIQGLKKSLDLEIENNKELMTSKTETTNPVFTDLKCYKSLSYVRRQIVVVKNYVEKFIRKSQ